MPKNGQADVVAEMIRQSKISEADAHKIVETSATRAMEKDVIPWIKTRATIGIAIGVFCLMVLPAIGITAVLLAWAWSMVR